MTISREDKLACRNIERWLSLVEPVLGPATENGGGYWGTSEWCFPCPLHAWGDPTSDGLILSVHKYDPTSPRWFCRKCTPNGENPGPLFARLIEVGVPDEALPLAAGGSAGSSGRHTPTAVPRRPRAASPPTVDLPDEDILTVYSEMLLESPLRLAYLTGERMWAVEDIAQFGIGHDPVRKRYTFPQRDESGRLVNVRWWKPDAPKDGPSPRWLHTTGHGKDARAWPLPPLLDAPPGSDVYVVGGEADAMAALARGVIAITGPGGETRALKPEDIALLAGHRVHVLYDSDRAGRAGGQAEAERIAEDGRCEAVWIHDLYPDNPAEPAPGTPKDLTDWIRDGGGIPS